MPQWPPPPDDPTGEEEALEFDGTQTDQLDDTYRFRIVMASESGNGAVGSDDRGRPRWKWITEFDGAKPDAIERLVDPSPALTDESTPYAESPNETSHDPYAPGVFAKSKPTGE
jgi:hypothetical protein